MGEVKKKALSWGCPTLERAKGVHSQNLQPEVRKSLGLCTVGTHGYLGALLTPYNELLI